MSELIEILKSNGIEKYQVKETSHFYLITGKCDGKFADDIEKRLKTTIISKDLNNIICASSAIIKDRTETNVDPEKSIQNWRIEECIDGTVLRLYHNNTKWYIATNNSYNGFNYWGDMKSNFSETFFKHTYSFIDYENLDTKYTYFFVYSSTLHNVIQYKKNVIYYVSRTDNSTFKVDYSNIPEIMIDRPHVYNFKTIQEIIDELSKTKSRGFIMKSQDRYEPFIKFDTSEFKTIEKLKGNRKNIYIAYVLLKNKEDKDIFKKYYNTINFDKTQQRFDEIYNKFKLSSDSPILKTPETFIDHLVKRKDSDIEKILF